MKIIFYIQTLRAEAFRNKYNFHIVIIQNNDTAYFYFCLSKDLRNDEHGQKR